MRNIFYIFSMLILATAGCGGNSGGSAPVPSQETVATPIASPDGGWSGRAWTSDNDKLFYQRYTDTSPTLVDNALKPASRSSISVPSLSKNGQYYAVYASDHDVSVTDFSVRRTSDAAQLASFWSPRYTSSLSISNDGRYLAWDSATDYYAKIAGTTDLSVIEVKSGEGLKVIATWPTHAVTSGLQVAGFTWAWDGRLLLISSTGQVLFFSPQTAQITQVGQLPSQFNGKKIYFGSAARINRAGDKLAGIMEVGDDKTEIWVANIDGSGMRQHTAVGTMITTAAWSPDGTSIHGGDCRTAIYGPYQFIDTGGRYSWIASAETENLSLMDSKKLTAKFKVENYPNYLPCSFMWTE